MTYYNFGLRPYDEIDAVELARYAKARRITDNRKLAAMLPAWVKRELRANYLPPIEYDFSQRYPLRLFTVLTPDSHRPAVFKEFHALARTKGYSLDTTGAYVQAWNRTNNYVEARP